MNEEMRKYFSDLGRRGGKARAKKLSKKRLSEIARMGVEARLTARSK